MKHFGTNGLRGLVFLGAMAASGATSRADTLFYGGDWLRDAHGGYEWLGYWQSSSSFQYNYENFTVPSGQSWKVTGLFANTIYNLRDGLGSPADPTIDTATYSAIHRARYEVRSGLSAGDGGTLIAAGELNATVVPTGEYKWVWNEYRVSVSLPSALDLSPGTYWFAVSPVIDNLNAFVNWTDGTNGIGQPLHDRSSYVYGVMPGYNDEPANPNFIHITQDYSVGVLGTAQATPIVPLPGTAGMAGVGIVGIVLSRALGRIRKRPA